MILENTFLVRCDSGPIGWSSFLLGFCVMVDLVLFIFWQICPLVVFIDGGRCLVIRFIGMFSHGDKYPFLIYLIFFYWDKYSGVVPPIQL